MSQTKGNVNSYRCVSFFLLINCRLVVLVLLLKLFISKQVLKKELKIVLLYILKAVLIIYVSKMFGLIQSLRQNYISFIRFEAVGL